MALMKGSKIPEDAVVLDELEAMSYIWEVVNKWESWKDVWALRYGPMLLGAINSFTGLTINRHYRWRFKLGTYGYLSSSIPVAVMPGLITLLFHKHLANRYSTYRIPNLFEGPRVMFKFLAKHTKPFTGTLSFILIAQLLASSFVTYYELRNTVNLNRKMMEIEKEAEQSLDQKIS